MCYNCGCGMLNNDMGNDKNITEKTFKEAADVSGQTVEETKRHILEQLKKQLGE